jgi:hypothetical protein
MSVAIEVSRYCSKQVAATATRGPGSALVFLPYTLAEAQALMAGDEEAAQQQAVETHMLKTRKLAQPINVCDTGALALNFCIARVFLYMDQIHASTPR